MRIARIATADGPRSVLADGPDWIEIADPFAGTLRPTGPRHPAATATLLAPARPLVVLGMAHNGAPGDRDRPRQAFLKSPRTVVGPGDSIVVDDDLGQINVECELAVVIRRPCRHLTADQVPDAILGFTVGNDVTAVDQIALDEKLTQAKNGDGFTPLGPWLETDLDSADVPMSVRINGRTVASASTRQLAWDITEQLVYLTRYLPLGPGDVVLTGAPGTFHPVKPGDLVEVALGGIGSLANPVVSRPRTG
ncbi:MAG TPA: fumarylacetoacetate hydrolase family protein [Nakamurella multipartita]|nr:fumarylacetoacetate hydrolase family protein [Nakamurella multipartita]